jgi:hypothetical protein
VVPGVGGAVAEGQQEGAVLLVVDDDSAAGEDQGRVGERGRRQ